MFKIFFNKIMFLHFGSVFLILLVTSTSCVKSKSFFEDTKNSTEKPGSSTKSGSSGKDAIVRTIFVDIKRSESKPSDGSSWDTAFKNIQEAIDAAVDNTNIYIADGTYLSPNIAITSKKNLKLFGGCKAGQSCERNSFHRDTAEGWTILDGDAKKDNLVKINGACEGIHFEGGFIFQNMGDGSAFKASGIKDRPLKDITIADSKFLSNENYGGGGNASAELQSGAIVVIHAKGVELNRVDGDKNKATYGGVMAAFHVESLKIFGGQWQKNEVRYAGGALYITDSSDIDIKDLQLLENKQTHNIGGGAIFIKDCPTKGLKISDVKFLKNSGTTGGGLFVDNCQVELSRSNFSDNRASIHDGGAIYLGGPNDVKIDDSIFFHNSSYFVGGVISIKFRSFPVKNKLILVSKPEDISDNISEVGKGNFLSIRLPINNPTIDMIKEIVDLGSSGISLNDEDQVVINYK